MKLRELLENVEILYATADLDGEISGVSYDSRTTRPGDLFVAMTGFAADGHRFIPQALEKGAAAVVCQRLDRWTDGKSSADRESAGTGGESFGDNAGKDADTVSVPVVQVPDPRRALGIIGANFYGHPASHMVIVGVTGTNGKTTTTYLLKSILEQGAGAKVGLIGTNQNMIGAEVLPTERTTPESFELQGLFARMLAAGCTHVVMEVSSHALALDRVYGVPYEVGVFTNLTQDHLDFHETMENYCDAKAVLFRNCRRGALNADDPWTARIAADASCQCFYYGIQSPTADLRAEDITLASDHVSFTAVHGAERAPVYVGIPGGFTVYNTLDSLAAAHLLGVPLAKSAEILRHTPPILGRVEPVPTPGKAYTILIDYAHSPDGLENVLKSVKGFAKGRTVALFGCGGDRDRTKRPKMGRIAGKLADFVIVTTDNPRTERPSDIIADILPGLADCDTPHVVVEDRIEAIHYAMDHGEAGDVIVLCGKGHETYQEINHVKHHMDEREIVAEYLAAGH